MSLLHTFSRGQPPHHPSYLFLSPFLHFLCKSSMPFLPSLLPLLLVSFPVLGDEDRSIRSRFSFRKGFEPGSPPFRKEGGLDGPSSTSTSQPCPTTPRRGCARGTTHVERCASTRRNRGRQRKEWKRRWTHVAEKEPTDAWRGRRIRLDQARKLEGEVDAKLAAFARFASAESGTNHAASVQVAQTKANEIGQMLKRLREVNEDMEQGIRPGDASHTLARHRDILHDLEREFERASARIETLGSDAGTSSRDALLAGATAMSGGNYANRDNALLRERSAIHGTLSNADDVVHQAQSVSITMGEQRRVFDGIGGKTETLQGRFPILHGLMTSIQRKRSKDTLVLAGVIAVCVVFLILYRVSK